MHACMKVPQRAGAHARAHTHLVHILYPAPTRHVHMYNTFAKKKNVQVRDITNLEDTYIDTKIDR
jgi:hypothetical protein